MGNDYNDLNQKGKESAVKKAAEAKFTGHFSLSQKENKTYYVNEGDVFLEDWKELGFAKPVVVLTGVVFKIFAPEFYFKLAISRFPGDGQLSEEDIKKLTPYVNALSLNDGEEIWVDPYTNESFHKPIEGKYYGTTFKVLLPPDIDVYLVKGAGMRLRTASNAASIKAEADLIKLLSDYKKYYSYATNTPERPYNQNAVKEQHFVEDPEGKNVGTIVYDLSTAIIPGTNSPYYKNKIPLGHYEFYPWGDHKIIKDYSYVIEPAPYFTKYEEEKEKEENKKSGYGRISTSGKFNTQYNRTENLKKLQKLQEELIKLKRLRDNLKHSNASKEQVKNVGEQINDIQNQIDDVNFIIHGHDSKDEELKTYVVRIGE